MKYLIIALMAVTANAQTILNQCYNASYATGYVYENVFNVAVKEKSSDLLKLLASEELEILSEKENSFVVKVDLNNWLSSEYVLEEINSLPEARVSCKYQL